MAEWCFVRPGDVDSDEAWEPIRLLLDQYCESYRAEDVRAAVGNGQFQLWLARDDGGLLAVLITQLIHRRDGLICVVNFCGGREMHKWIGDRHLLARWAKDQGCIAVKGERREGWLWFLPDAKQTGIVWEMKL